MGTAKKIFTNWRVIMLLIFLVFAYFSINGGIAVHFFDEGISIKSVGENSSAALAGIENPSTKLSPLSREKIISVAGSQITSVQDYYQAVGKLEDEQTFKLITNKKSYTLLANLDQSESIDNQLNVIDLGIKVEDVPTSNIKKGLDLAGGTRVLLKPVETVSEDDLDLTISNLKERLNVYGLSDVVVRAASDLAGENFILIEIAGVTENEVKELLAKQGKFEAKIGNETVFFGGKKDITYVCRSAECSGLGPQRQCFQAETGYGCNFFFGITLTPEAAQRQADLTDQLTIVTDENGRYLSEKLQLFLDDKMVEELSIAADLKGRATTDIQITGSEKGISQQEAMSNTLQEMKRLQTIMVTGSLPVKLEVVKMDTISPSLGKEFLQNILLVGVLAVLAVVVVVFLRYRKIKVVLPMVLTLISEMILILGFAALVGWNLDLAAIAGIIIVAGTGVDHLIVITDETLRGEKLTDWKKKIKNAMFIVTGAYLTTCAGMLPLWFAGAGLLKGFAFTTIVGISFGVLIARPAYAAIIEQLLDN